MSRCRFQGGSRFVKLGSPFESMASWCNGVWRRYLAASLKGESSSSHGFRISIDFDIQGLALAYAGNMVGA